MSADPAQNWMACYVRFQDLTEKSFELRLVMQRPGFGWDKEMKVIVAPDDAWNALPRAEEAEKAWKGKCLRFYGWMETCGGRSIKMQGLNPVSWETVEDAELTDTDTELVDDDDEDYDMLEDEVPPQSPAGEKGGGFAAAAAQDNMAEGGVRGSRQPSSPNL